ncbi:VCBS repeat-containing protein [Labrenzia sp. EL_142]|nr:VCBS repeat-containing protein [Labrenzia sp. EL_142]
MQQNLFSLLNGLRKSMTNTPPTAVAITASSDENNAVLIHANFTDPDPFDVHTFSVDVTATLGSVTNNNDGTFAYDPGVNFDHLASGETAMDTFTYTVDDGNGGTSTQTVTVTINGQNDAPVAAAVTASADEDGSAVVIAGNFTDADTSDTHTFTVDTTATVGSVTNNNDGTFSYDPGSHFQNLAAGETTVDTFTYTVDDGNGGTSTQTVTVTINGQNDAPVAQAVSAATDEDTPIAIAANFTDADTSDTHTFTVDTTGTAGNVTNNNDGTFSYNPGAALQYLQVGETATDTFTYTVDDGNGGTSTQTVTVTINGQNDAPVIDAITAVAEEDGPTIVLAPSFSDIDSEGPFVVTFDDSGTTGSLTDNGDGTFNYHANGQFEHLNPGQTETDTFTYTVTDNHGGTSTRTLSIVVEGQVEPHKLVASDGQAIDLFGYSTQINDLGVVVVGALGDDDTANGAGSVYVYTPNGTGYLETKILASDGAGSDLFGINTAINGSGVVVVGSYLDDDNGTDSGSAYVYAPTAGGSYSELKLTASDGAANDRFGSHVSVSDSGVIAIGAPSLGVAGGASGAVYVYAPDGSGGYSEVKLTASDQTAGNYFGFATDVNQHGAVYVGASSFNGGSSATGTAYVYIPDGLGGYTETKLLSPDPEGGDNFGLSGAINGSGTIVIGAPGNDADGVNSGALYVYQPDGSGNYAIQKILSSDIEANDNLGRSVDINDAGVIVVGAEGDDEQAGSAGAAFVYKPDGAGGYTEFKLTAYDGAQSDLLGYSVSINNDGVVSIGAYGDDDNGSRSGSVYTFVPDENGDYKGADGTIYGEHGQPALQSYAEAFDVSGEPVAAKIVASHGRADDIFGIATQINDSGIFVASAVGDDDKGLGAGSVYVYTSNGGDYFETKLVASDGDQGDSFGQHSAINESGMIVIGASTDDDNGTDSGSVYVYAPTAGGSYSELKLTASDGAANDRFGSHVSVSDSGVIAIGAPSLGVAGGASGAVYVYAPDGSGGYSEVKLTASDQTAGNYFGFATDVNQHGAVYVGASSFNGGSSATGTAYVYIPDGLGGYTETKLLSPDPEGGDNFGLSGAINGSGTIVIGAPGNDADGVNSGALYVYQPDGSGNYAIQKILSSDIEANDNLGRSVDINDAGVIVVGAEGDDEQAGSAGAAFVYKPDGAGGYTEFKLTAYDGAQSDLLGYSVSINNDGVVSIGAYGDDDNGSRSGSVYTFVPDENGDYKGADGTIYGASTSNFSQTITGTNTANLLVGTAGDDIVTAGGGDDTITGRGGNDTVTGGSGADTFVFLADYGGNTIVTDFEAGPGVVDTLEINQALLSDFQSLLNVASEVGNDVLIEISIDKKITLENTVLLNLDNDDFVFV